MEKPKFRVVRPEDSSRADEDEENEVQNLPAVPEQLSDRVARLLQERIEQQEMRMADSCARRAAKDNLQADLDINVAVQTARIAVTVNDKMRARLEELYEKTDRAVTRHPELELDFREMQGDSALIFKQLNKYTAVGYARRFSWLRQDKERD